MHREFVVFDLETTGLSARSNEIIQIAGKRMRNGKAVADEIFSTFVRPEQPIPSFITSYTGISNRAVAKAPPIPEALMAFSEFVGDAVLIAHNGQRFDAKFLSAACEKSRLRARQVDLIDSIHFSKRLFGSIRGTGHSLDVVLARMNVTNFEGRRHDARGDVSGLAQAIERMWSELKLDASCRDIPRTATFLPQLPI